MCEFPVSTPGHYPSRRSIDSALATEERRKRLQAMRCQHQDEIKRDSIASEELDSSSSRHSLKGSTFHKRISVFSGKMKKKIVKRKTGKTDSQKVKEPAGVPSPPSPPRRTTSLGNRTVGRDRRNISSVKRASTRNRNSLCEEYEPPEGFTTAPPGGSRSLPKTRKRIDNGNSLSEGYMALAGFPHRNQTTVPKGRRNTNPSLSAKRGGKRNSLPVRGECKSSPFFTPKPKSTTPKAA